MIHRDPKPNRGLAVTIAAGALVLLALVGTMDYHDAERELEHYCEMVEAGHWPDYRNLKRDGECDEKID